MDGKKKGRKQENLAPWAIRTIGVTGTGPGAGATFLAASLAWYYSHLRRRRVCFTQLGDPGRWGSRPLLFDQLAMDKRFANKGFDDVYRDALQEERPLACANWEDGINWQLMTPFAAGRETGVPVSVDEAFLRRLVMAARGDLCIFDIAGEDRWNPLLTDLDMVLVVADPLPARLLGEQVRIRRLMELEAGGLDLRVVINRMNPGVNRRQLRRFFRRPFLELEAFSPAVLYTLAYHCQPPWGASAVENALSELFTKLSQ